MHTLLLGLAAGLALMNWLAVSRGWRMVEIITKPLTILALLGYVFAAIKYPADAVWLVLGLAFSLAGDILLLGGRGLFPAGLGAFLFAHIAYIVILNPIPPLRMPHLVAAALICVLVALPAARIYRRMATGMQSTGHPGLKLPVLAYCFALSLMVISALFTMLRGGWLPLNALTVSAGALVFMLSDTLLGWERFVASLPSGKLWTMATYHTGQILFVLGVVGHILSRPAG